MRKSVELKIKIKSLAAEAVIIREEERLLHGMQKWDVQHHRKTVVRDAARRTLMAYAHIRGKSMELNASKDAKVRKQDMEAVRKMIVKYGDDESVKRFDELSLATGNPS